MNLSTAVRHRLLLVFTGALVVLLAIGASAARAQTPNVPSFERRVEADDDKTWAVLGKDNLASYRQNLTKFARPYTYWGGGETLYSGYPPRAGHTARHSG